MWYWIRFVSGVHAYLKYSNKKFWKPHSDKKKKKYIKTGIYKNFPDNITFNNWGFFPSKRYIIPINFRNYSIEILKHRIQILLPYNHWVKFTCSQIKLDTCIQLMNLWSLREIVSLLHIKMVLYINQQSQTMILCSMCRWPLFSSQRQYCSLPLCPYITATLQAFSFLFLHAALHEA